MAEPVGTIIQVSYRLRMNNQRLMNVLHYRVIDQSSVVSYVDEMALVAGIFADMGINGIGIALRAVSPNSLMIESVSAQAISPLRARRVEVAVVQNGTGGTGQIQNVQAAITFWHILSGRRFIGGKRVCIPSSLIVSGEIQPPLKADLEVLASRWSTPVQETVGDAIYEPVIYHRNPPLIPPAHRIDGFIVQTSSRVMRRRTVGVGE